VGQVLSLCFRTYGQNRNSPTVSSTAAATVRQAVAIVFDHAVAGPATPTASGASSPAWTSSEVSEASAAALLQDVCQMAGGEPSNAVIGLSTILPCLVLKFIVPELDQVSEIACCLFSNACNLACLPAHTAVFNSSNFCRSSHLRLEGA
jgi:hypothetical protein